MNIADVRQKARDALHSAMSVTGLYSDDEHTDLEVSVRLHRKSAYIGDDYDQFSPGHFSEINRVIIDLREVTPKRGATIQIPDFNVTVQVENWLDQGEFKALCEVRV